MGDKSVPNRDWSGAAFRSLSGERNSPPPQQPGSEKVSVPAPDFRAMGRSEVKRVFKEKRQKVKDKAGTTF